MQHVPYVYWIKNKTSGLKYVGVRYAKICHPDDLWVTYFTSSKSVHKLIALYGKEDFKIKILHTFTNANDAILREERYIRIATKRKDYVNFNSTKVWGPEVASKAGKIGGRSCFERKLGFHKFSREENLLRLKRLREIQFIQKKNPFAHATKETQSARGKRGGPKNKGFIWYTDGLRDFKYTKKMQEVISFEQFLLENTEFIKGRHYQSRDPVAGYFIKE